MNENQIKLNFNNNNPNNIEEIDDNYCNWCFKYENINKCPQRKTLYGFNK